MSKFNSMSKGKDTTVNHAGSKAYELTPELALYSKACTAMLQSRSYITDVSSQIESIGDDIKRVSPEFANELTSYIRNDMNLRSVPIVMAVELAKLGRLKKETVINIIQRADEITELLSYYQSANNRNGTKKLNKLSKAIEKGIKEIFEGDKFNEYHFAKYDRKTEVRFKDALFLTHPSAKKSNSSIEIKEKLFKDIINGTLPVPTTWETVISEVGQKKYDTETGKEKAVKEAWEMLIDEKKLGYMATLRNLRNMLEANISSAHVEKVGKYLSNEKAVLNSKQFPFRFWSAFKMLQETENGYSSYLLDKLDDAIIHSSQNIKGFGLDTTVLIACDVSGSMQTTISEKSTVQLYDIGLTLAMLLQSRCKSVITGMFGDTWKAIQVPKKSILHNVQQFHSREGEVGYSTNGFKVIEWMIDNRKKIDKVMMFTDCQLWDSRDRYIGLGNSIIPELWDRYKKEINPDAKLYLFDLSGYGNTPLKVNENDVFLISGFSDKIFDVMHALEDSESVVDIIMNRALNSDVTLNGPIV